MAARAAPTAARARASLALQAHESQNHIRMDSRKLPGIADDHGSQGGAHGSQGVCNTHIMALQVS